MHERTRTRRILAMGLCLGVLLIAVPAGAHGTDQLVDEPRELDLPEVKRAIRLHKQVHTLFARYEQLERRAGRGWLAVVQAEQEVAEAQDRVSAADQRLEQRVRTAYQFGPGGTIEALLGAGSFTDLASISVYTERTISLDETVLRASLVALAEVQARRALAQASRAGLEPRLEQLRILLHEIVRKHERVMAIAEAASLADEELRAQQAVIAQAVARQGTWDIVGSFGRDQGWLLALLGPTGGRTCDTPEGLVATGESFDGFASWYGWEFGGQPTATGAIFDPRLFTVASRTLPFGTFLRVHHGDRCAVVLVNDRGPYGRLERVLDLSEAAAEYLGVGVSMVHAEILLPVEPRPAADTGG